MPRCTRFPRELGKLSACSPLDGFPSAEALCLGTAQSWMAGLGTGECELCLLCPCARLKIQGEEELSQAEAVLPVARLKSNLRSECFAVTQGKEAECLLLLWLACGCY